MLHFVYYSKKLCVVTASKPFKRSIRFIGEPVGWHVVDDRESVKCFCCILRDTMRVGWGGSKLEHYILNSLISKPSQSL